MERLPIWSALEQEFWNQPAAPCIGMGQALLRRRFFTDIHRNFE
jgi:hypothetical protein